MAKVNSYLEDYTHLIEGLLELHQTTFDPCWHLTASELAEVMVEHFRAPDCVLLRLAGLAVEPRYGELARAALGPMQPLLARHPLGFGQWLIALDYALAHPREIGIVGNADAADTRVMLAVCNAGYRPHQVLAVGVPDDGQFTVPLLRGRDQIEGQATAYVCVDFVCRRPVTDPEALRVLV